MIHFHTWIFQAEFVTASPFFQIALFINFCCTAWSFSFFKRWCTTIILHATLFEWKYAILDVTFATVIVFILPFGLTYVPCTTYITKFMIHILQSKKSHLTFIIVTILIASSPFTLYHISIWINFSGTICTFTIRRSCTWIISFVITFKRKYTILSSAISTAVGFALTFSLTDSPFSY